MTEAMWDNQDFTAPVVTIINIDTRKAMGAVLKSDFRCQKFVQAAYSSGSRSSISNDRSVTDIADYRIIKKSCSELSEKQAPDLSPRIQVMVDHRLGRSEKAPETELDVLGLSVVTPVNYRVSAAVDYRNYRFVNKMSCHGDNVAQELRKVARRIAV